MFVQNDDNCLYPNPHSGTLNAIRGQKDGYDLQTFEFIGRLLGKAIYESVLVEPRFTNFFLRKLLGLQNYVDDLWSYDQNLYKNLVNLKHDSKMDIGSLGLTYSVQTNFLSISKTHDLIKNGRNVNVSSDNLLNYIRHVADFRLNRQLKKQVDAFRKGFWSIIEKDWLCLFSPEELTNLIGGTSEDFNVQDLKQNVVYQGEYHMRHKTIVLFWEVVTEMSSEDRRKLLKFVTSCSRAPLLGFKVLNPKFGIALPHNNTNALPTASTCANLLKLPRYTNKDLLRSKLLYSIRSNAGFEMT